ncbi:MAG: hypothetical protein ISS23_04135 [Nanoarchaeota archaeon]|nr:hypothetical protein [Nanoarchaeota archaeon]
MALVDPEQIRKNFLKLFSEESKKEEKFEKLDLSGEGIELIRKQKIIMQQMQAGGEAYYFWILNFIRNPNALFYDVEKTSDIYTASEASSYFGAIEARKEAQMRNVNQYMATIGQLTKNLFQMIRELRVIDERRDYYEKSEEGDESAEVALKGMWVSLVEGGAENPLSVTGMARKLGFVILPDLFFKINPKKGSKGVDKEVDALAEQGINARVRSVLKQKLMQYYLWKERTGGELKWRKNFVLKSVAQTYHSIKLYSHWLKPYLRNIRKLQMAGMESPDLVSAFESSYVELELFATKDKYEAPLPGTAETELVEREFRAYFPCIKVNFSYVTRPEMAFQQEYTHKGAVHAGRTTIEIEGYVLTKKQLDQYRVEKQTEDLDLIQSVEASVESLGEELQKYLKEAGELDGKKEEKKVERGMAEGALEPFTAIFKGFGDLFGGLVPRKKKGGFKKMSDFELEQEKAAATASVKTNVFILYDVFKKAHGMLSW